MRNRHRSIWLFAVLAVVVLVTPGLATAGPVLNSVGVTWTNPIGTGPLNVVNPFNTGAGNATIFGIRWGTPYFNGEPQPLAPDTTRSGLGFDPSFPPPAAPPLNTYFHLGDLWHFNQQIWNEGYKLTSADLTLTTEFAGVGTHDWTFRIGVDETYNKFDPCPYGGIDGSACDDKITIHELDTTPWTFTTGDGTYRYSFGGCGDGNSFYSSEFTDNNTPCDAKLSTVPNPSTLLFIGLGLVGLIGFTRMRAFRK